jgi:hypothetical protein
MRTSIVKVIAVVSLLLNGAAFGADLAEHEKTCLDLGFKKRTSAYGECVLELDRRTVIEQKRNEQQRADQQRQVQEQQRQVEQQRNAAMAARGDGTPDHQTCNRFGFIAGTSQYSDCRLRIDIAKREAQQRQVAFEAEQRRYEAEQAQYQARMIEFEKEKDRQRGLALLRFSSALASGTSPYLSENLGNAGRASLGIAPVAPTRPQIQNFSITGPSGRMTNCTAINNNINCF